MRPRNAQHPGTVDYVDGQTIIVLNDDGDYDEYLIPKFQRSNRVPVPSTTAQSIRQGDRVEAGDVLADGPSCDHGELALGANLMVAYMPWEGYNYEDAVVSVQERVVAEDLLTSIHIAEYEIDARSIKLGDEEITREIPNISDDQIADLEADGVIRIGAEVFPGDILVGKVTPKGESEPSSEERLAPIFGAKAHEVRDTSLRCPARRRRPRHRRARVPAPRTATSCRRRSTSSSACTSRRSARCSRATSFPAATATRASSCAFFPWKTCPTWPTARPSTSSSTRWAFLRV